jgi:hypothetical protein
MVALQCPSCGESQVIEEIRIQDPKTGRTVNTASLGCIYQIAFVTTLASFLGVVLMIIWPSQPFAEAIKLIVAITMLFVAAGIYTTWRHSSWTTLRQRTCKSCGHSWTVDLQQLAPH